MRNCCCVCDLGCGGVILVGVLVWLFVFACLGFAFAVVLLVWVSWWVYVGGYGGSFDSLVCLWLVGIRLRVLVLVVFFGALICCVYECCLLVFVSCLC